MAKPAPPNPTLPAVRALQGNSFSPNVTTYAPSEVVCFNGNIYIAFEAVTGASPDTDSRWRLMTIVGSAGPAGSAGEVTAAQLAEEISFAFGGTSANSHTVQLLDTFADLSATIAKINELIGRRKGRTGERAGVAGNWVAVGGKRNHVNTGRSHTSRAVAPPIATSCRDRSRCAIY